ncbi:MAG: hypothetical protein OXI63_14160 [Candidatus Poribacteria bacterium]|nr:hypothetical protein [Candidatus Poribacteria bacterium]
MNDGFGEEQDLSRIRSDVPGRAPDLSPQQREIRRNLGAIGPEIAAYYLDGIKILHSTDLETAASLLAHIAREIDGGLRDILSSDQARANIQKQLTEEVLTKLGDYSELKERKGHIASILAALGIDDALVFLSTDDVRVNFAIRWINVSTQFHRFAHRHGAWKVPRAREEFEVLWYEFEGILSNLVGSFLDLLSRLDRILAYKEPTSEIRSTLPNLLGSKERRAYFFSKLESPTWLEPLKEDGWFDPDWNPMPQESPDQPGYYYSSRWHALEYVVKVSTHPQCPINILVDIVNAITDESRERIDNGRTDLDTVKIISTLPIDRIEPQHITFMGAALKSSQKYGLMEQEIGQTILPKLLDGGKRKLTLALLSVILEVESVDGRIRPIMNEHWLEEALKKHWETIASVCDVEAAQITLAQIRALDAEDSSVFHFIHPVENDLLHLSRADYAKLIVNFTSSIFQFAQPVSITETIQGLLQESSVIIKRIAVRAITDHYRDLKHLFWEWEGNPLDGIGLETEVSELIQANSHTFNEDEMEQVLQWIESTQY